MAISACSSGGGSDVKFPETVVLKDNDIVPILANSELTVGLNRMAVGILDKDGVPIVDAKVHFTFYDLNDGKQTKKMDMPAISRVPARDAGIPETQEIKNPDGSTRTEFNAGDDVGIYTANVNFDRAGDWGMKIDVDSSKPKVKKSLLPRFNVLDKSFTPAIGSPAPKSHNATTKDTTDLSVLDSSANPSPEMHGETIADAIDAHHPTVVLFAVPGYCESRLCGPELEIMRKLYHQNQDKADFIHVEFYKDPGNPARTPVDAVREYNLRSEPWFFFIDNKGNVAYKIEGPASLDELQQALKTIAPS
jgi:hypothetical protein